MKSLLARVAGRAARAPAVLATARRSLCATSLDVDVYNRVINLTLEGLQDVYDDEADDNPQLAMDVVYAVRI